MTKEKFKIYVSFQSDFKVLKNLFWTQWSCNWVMDYSSLGPFQIWYKKSFFLLRHSNLHIYYFIENENLFNSMSYSIFFLKSHFSTEMHIKRDLKKKIWLIKFCWGGGMLSIEMPQIYRLSSVNIHISIHASI